MNKEEKNNKTVRESSTQLNVMAEDLTYVTSESIKTEEDTNPGMSSASLQNEQNSCDLQEQGLPTDTCDVPAMPHQGASAQPSDATTSDNKSKESLPGNRSMTRKENLAALCPPCDPVQRDSQPEDVNAMTIDLKLVTNCLLKCDHSLTHYCRKHKIFCCRVLSQLHCYCENMVYLEEGLIYRHRETDIQVTKTLLGALDKILETESTCINQVKRKTKEFLTEVKSKIAANNKQDNEFEDIQDKVDRNQIKVIQNHVDRIAALQKHRGNICDCLQTIENVNLPPLQSTIARHKVFSLAQAQAEEGIKALTSEILEMKMSIHDESNTTRFDVYIESKKPEVSAFVSLFNKTLTSLFNHLFNTCTAQDGREPYPLITCDISFVASAERSNIQAGKWIPGGTYLPDNTILLSDTDNKQLIKLDENLGFLEKLPVAGWPYGVCVSSDGNRVHVVCDENKVVSHTLQGSWREVHRFGTELGAQGIACHGDRIVTGHYDYVVIYDSTGTELSRINTSGWSMYPALSHDGRMLYHVGCLRLYFVCRSMEDVTQEVWRYSSPKFWGPCGIDTDRDGNTLIVGWGSDNVHQVSGDGKTNRILINKMKYMEQPWGLFTNRNNNTFCVTSVDDKVCCVEMYRLDD